LYFCAISKAGFYYPLQAKITPGSAGPDLRTAQTNKFSAIFLPFHLKTEVKPSFRNVKKDILIGRIVLHIDDIQTG
jgi:hypothetical protein